ncbi:mitochondrial ribosomal protein L28 [Oratosquilla oratoria]|uniref:mitochondrial ribosomal protein L28 n=1 Tax=Oratosquilla oratoria TaxID=337810 RepID=UPI003F762224
MNRVAPQLLHEALTKPWVLKRPFQHPDVKRLPEHYLKFCYDWKYGPKTAVHYIPEEGNLKIGKNGQIEQVQNVPIPTKIPKELHDGIWGGEEVIKGFQKRKRLRRKVPHYWVPTLKSAVLYSEVLDKYMEVVVTERTLKLIDQHYGLDSYLLETSPRDLMSELALGIKREILLALSKKTLYPDNVGKQKELLEKYKDFIIPEEEAEWYGLPMRQALRKLRHLDREANQPVALKHNFRKDFFQYLKENKDSLVSVEETKKEEESGPAAWLSKINPFAKG